MKYLLSSLLLILCVFPVPAQRPGHDRRPEVRPRFEISIGTDYGRDNVTQIGYSDGRAAGQIDRLYGHYYNPWRAIRWYGNRRLSVRPNYRNAFVRGYSIGYRRYRRG